MIRNSLNLRLWLTIAIAVVPIFLFMLLDYSERREQAVADIHAEISDRLADANREAKAAHRAVGLALRIGERAVIHSHPREPSLGVPPDNLRAQRHQISKI